MLVNSDLAVGGAQSLMAAMAKYFAAAGRRVAVVGREGDGPHAADLPANGVRVACLVRRWRWDLRPAIQLRGLLDEFDASCVISDRLAVQGEIATQVAGGLPADDEAAECIDDEGRIDEARLGAHRDQIGQRTVRFGSLRPRGTIPNRGVHSVPIPESPYMPSSCKAGEPGWGTSSPPMIHDGIAGRTRAPAGTSPLFVPTGHCMLGVHRAEALWMACRSTPRVRKRPIWLLRACPLPIRRCGVRRQQA